MLLHFPGLAFSSLGRAAFWNNSRRNFFFNITVSHLQPSTGSSFYVARVLLFLLSVISAQGLFIFFNKVVERFLQLCHVLP